MKRLCVALPNREYDIVIEKGVLLQAGEYCKKVLPKAKKIIVVTDDNVAPLYSEIVEDSLSKAGFSVFVTVIPAGETSKSISMLEHLYNVFMTVGLTRTDAIIALGGGVVGDLAGFAASTILRGVDFVQIPTTLLAQVDSSVGGKVAIDLKAGKNLAGSFWQPKLVLMDPNCLESLSDRIFNDGMAEVIKYGCIMDADFFELLLSARNRSGVMERIEDILYTCCEIKAKVVIEDERDTGLRMILNFGHTLGHAYELAYNYSTYTHGQAVAAGMCRAAEIGVKLGVSPDGISKMIKEIVAEYDLPQHIDCEITDYSAAIGLDKKGSGDMISVILLKKIGETQIVNIEKEKLIMLIGE